MEHYQLLKQVEKLEKQLNLFWGSLTFEQIERVFGVDLIGFDEEETERRLESVTSYWESMSLKDKAIKINTILENF